MPTTSEMSRSASGVASRPSISMRPVTSARYERGTRPLRTRRSVLLPQPEGPATSTISPLDTENVASTSEGCWALR
ncbi:hypothetical protein Q0F99_07760 [Rathayibacter oskolensis]|nr:hypothetical protein [Rathayibacter oskolensis]WKK72789.1 hypothetical protein Q0F99_07760 [Rathayibacter oskolensis]